MRGELAEVVGSRVRVDDPSPGEARETDVRQRRERHTVGAHLLERLERGQEAGAVVRAHGGDVESAQPVGGFPGGHAGERLGALVEGEERDDRQARNRPDGFDRVDDLVEVVERLDDEEVGAAALEDLGLLGEEVAADAGRGRLAERADRPRDEDVAPGDLAGVSGELDRRRVDPLEVVLEEVRGELAAVGSEGVRLDHVGAGVDEADVEGHDRVRGAEVRFLGAAEPGYGGGDQRAHAPVGHEGRPLVQPVDESGGRHALESSEVRRSSRPVNRGRGIP